MEVLAKQTIKFDDFYDKYKVRRNPIQSSSPYHNTMIEFDEIGEEVIEEEDQRNVWTLLENTKDKGEFILSPGITYSKYVIGFFICKEKWTTEKEYILE